MSSIKIDSLLEEALQERAFQGSLKELNALSNIIEDQPWHTRQSVLDHSIKTLEGLDEILSTRLPLHLRRYAASHLSERLDAQTRRELLRLAALLHDIGKLISLQHNAAGVTSSPSHGLIGSWVAQPIVQKLGLSAVEQQYVLDLISEHLVGSDLIEMAINNGTPSERIVDLLVDHRSDRVLELLLIAYADWLGCNITPELDPIRDKRIAIMHSCLDIIAKKNLD